MELHDRIIIVLALTVVICVVAVILFASMAARVQRVLYREQSRELADAQNEAALLKNSEVAKRAIIARLESELTIAKSKTPLDLIRDGSRRQNPGDELMLLPFCSTHGAAHICLSRYAQQMPIEMSREEMMLSQIILAGFILRTPAYAGGNREAMLQQALACYGSLIGRLPSDLTTVAISDTKRFLELSEVRIHAVQEILVRLLNSGSDKTPDIVGICLRILNDGVESELKVLLPNVPAVRGLSRVDLCKLLRTAFPSVMKFFPALSRFYFLAVTHLKSFEPWNDPDKAAGLRPLFSEIQTRILDPVMLDSAHSAEYDSLTEWIVAIHCCLDKPRKPRPRIRHLSSGSHLVLDLQAELERSETSFRMSGTVMNLSNSFVDSGGTVWRGGAYIVVPNTHELWAADDKPYEGTILLKGTPSLRLRCSITRPTHDREPPGYRGLRVQWPRLSIREAGQLAMLLKEYPTKR